MFLVKKRDFQFSKINKYQQLRLKNKLYPGHFVRLHYLEGFMSQTGLGPNVDIVMRHNGKTVARIELKLSSVPRPGKSSYDRAQSIMMCEEAAIYSEIVHAYVTLDSIYIMNPQSQKPLKVLMIPRLFMASAEEVFGRD